MTNLYPARSASPPDGLSRRERQRLETRERIYNTALAEFREVGVAEAQIDRIAEKAGIARGTFYFHFSTKEHVLIELQHRAERALVERIEALGPPPESVADFCHVIVDAIADTLTDDLELRREVLAMYLRQSVGIEFAAEPLILLVVDYFADAAERGALRTDIAPEQIAILFLSFLFTVFMRNPGGERNLDITNLSIEVFVNGVAAPARG